MCPLSDRFADYHGFELQTVNVGQCRSGSASKRIVFHTLGKSPKYSVSEVTGYIKGKNAIHLACVYGERKRNFTGKHLWARGYFVSTVVCDKQVIRQYI